MSPKMKMLVFVLCIGVILTSILYLMDIQFGLGYYSLGRWAWVVIVVALILYFLLTTIAEKLKKRTE